MQHDAVLVARLGWLHYAHQFVEGVAILGEMLGDELGIVEVFIRINQLFGRAISTTRPLHHFTEPGVRSHLIKRVTSHVVNPRHSILLSDHLW